MNPDDEFPLSDRVSIIAQKFQSTRSHFLQNVSDVFAAFGSKGRAGL